MEKTMICVEHVSKQYRLGQIGETTLRDALQRMQAKIHRKEDPTKKVGSIAYGDNEIFQALSNVSFSVKEGERVGIIGRNGAGKSTLLKLISRVTAPTTGEIGLNGRVASMLEVGTGFHGELTGRENIYMNGAILGMSRKKIDHKINDIIDFSECRQFIDTPVKRYSSGMYVKLAFSVAAHLDSEILLMDEVLAVGDIAFQRKCLDKMNDISKERGRTILYVSHNMQTIRELCTRCLVLNKGELCFDGDVQQGIEIYMQTSFDKSATLNDVSTRKRIGKCGTQIRIQAIEQLGKESTVYEFGETMRIKFVISANEKFDYIGIRIEIGTLDMQFIGTTLAENIGAFEEGKTTVSLSFDTGHIVPGRYQTTVVVYQKDAYGNTSDLDIVEGAFNFEIVDTYHKLPLIWRTKSWGRIVLNRMEVLKYHSDYPPEERPTKENSGRRNKGKHNEQTNQQK